MSKRDRKQTTLKGFIGYTKNKAGKWEFLDRFDSVREAKESGAGKVRPEFQRNPR